MARSLIDEEKEAIKLLAISVLGGEVEIVPCHVCGKPDSGRRETYREQGYACEFPCSDCGSVIG